MTSVWKEKAQRKPSIRQVVPCDQEESGGSCGGGDFDMEKTVRSSFRIEECLSRQLRNLGVADSPPLGVAPTARAAARSAAATAGSGRLSASSLGSCRSGGIATQKSNKWLRSCERRFTSPQALQKRTSQEEEDEGTVVADRWRLHQALQTEVFDGGGPREQIPSLDTISSLWSSKPGSTALCVGEDGGGNGAKEGELRVPVREQHFIRGIAVTKEMEDILAKLESGFDTDVRAACEKVDFRFRNIRLSVEVSKAKAALMGGKAGKKEILRGVSGAVSSGQILAIIGPSGAGKTSLLDVLVGKMKAGTKGLSVTGDITVNGDPMSRSFFLENAAYVPQEDRLWSALTVRENLMFACKLYGPGMSQEECEQRVDEVVASLGLDSCQHTKVGNIFIKGVSGGQKRRTSIGMELVVHRKILFLDEPTSGLDAASASEIMALLGRLASEAGMVLITSVHQPSTRVFNSFDQVILLTMGQTAYFGPAVDSLEHFARLGQSPIGLVNPADFLLEITNSDFSDAEAVQQLADSWLQSPACATLDRRLGLATPSPVLPARRTSCLSGLRQLRALIARAGMNSLRDPAAYSLRLVLYLYFSFFLGSVYYRVGDDQSDVLSRVFLITWINAFNSFMDLAAIPVFTQEKEAVVKEVQNGQYGVGNFCIANAFVQIPFVFLIAMCCMSPVYPITNMSDDFPRYLQLVVILFLMLLVIESIAQIIGVLIKNFVLGIAAFASILAMFFIFNGFFIVPDDMPSFWVWIYWISPLRYSWEVMAKVVFDGRTYTGYDDCVTCYGETGEQVLDSLSAGGGSNLNEVSLLENGGILVALTVFWRLVHYFVLKRSMF